MSYIFQPERILLQKQIKKFNSYIKGQVLDIGAGSCSRYQSFFKYSEYIKMDVFEDDNIDIVGSVENIPFPDNSFDSIVCTQVFEHLQNPEKAVSEIKRVLKKGGHCLVTAPQVNELHEEPYDFFRYTKYGLKILFEKRELRTIEYEQRGGYFTLISQLKIRYLIDRFQLYDKKIIGRICSRIFMIYGNLMMWLDKIDRGIANRKHCIGWIFVFKK